MWENECIVGVKNLPTLMCLGLSPLETLLKNKELIDFIKNEQFDAAIVDFKGNYPWLALCSHLDIPMVTFWRYVTLMSDLHKTIS